MKPIYNPTIATPLHRSTLHSLVVWAACEWSSNGAPLAFRPTLNGYTHLPKAVRKAVRKRLAHLKSEADMAAFNRSRLEIAA